MITDETISRILGAHGIAGRGHLTCTETDPNFIIESGGGGRSGDSHWPGLSRLGTQVAKSSKPFNAVFAARYDWSNIGSNKNESNFVLSMF